MCTFCGRSTGPPALGEREKQAIACRSIQPPDCAASPSIPERLASSQGAQKGPPTSGRATCSPARCGRAIPAWPCGRAGRWGPLWAPTAARAGSGGTGGLPLAPSATPSPSSSTALFAGGTGSGRATARPWPPYTGRSTAPLTPSSPSSPWTRAAAAWASATSSTGIWGSTLPAGGSSASAPTPTPAATTAFAGRRGCKSWPRPRPNSPAPGSKR